MPSLRDRDSVVLFQSLGRIFSNGLEHPVALIGEAQQALLHERLQSVDVRAAHLLCGLERAAAGEDGETAEEALLVLDQKLMRPLDRGSERLLAGVGVAAALE